MARRDAADRLAEGETRSAEADRALKAAEAAMAAAREDRVRSELLLTQAEAARTMLAERIREHLDCAPEALPELAEIDPGLELPERTGLEAKLQKLLREREAIGPVNLRRRGRGWPSSGIASHRAAGRARRPGRGDRPAAPGIGSLNREGRERLLAAFEVVERPFLATCSRGCSAAGRPISS